MGSFNKKKLFLLLTIILIIFMFYYLDFGKHISMENIKKNTGILQQAVAQDYFGSVCRFMGIYILLTSFALPFAAFMTVIAGFLFGTFAGALYSCISATIGATCAFLIFKYLVGDFIKSRFANVSKLQKFRQESKKYGYSYLLSIHFSGLVPLFMINIFASLADIKIWTFCWTVAVGTFPAFLVYAFAGKQFNEINSMRDIFSVKILLAFLFLAALVSIPVIVRKFRKNVECV